MHKKKAQKVERKKQAESKVRGVRAKNEKSSSVPFGMPPSGCAEGRNKKTSKNKASTTKKNKPASKKKTVRKYKKKGSHNNWITGLLLLPLKLLQAKILRRMVRPLVLIMIWGCVATLIVLAYFAHDLPSTDSLYAALPGAQSVTVLASDGAVLGQSGIRRGKYVLYDALPTHLIEAVLATEDRRFFDHFGVDMIGITRAAFRNARAGHVVQGGSTITQQLAKITFLSSARTLKRKVQEAMLAMWLEYHYSKKEILTMYLNRVYLGSGNYGIDAASHSYFGKDTESINVNESAILAGLLKAPSRYSPFVNRQAALDRGQQVLDNMLDAGYVSAQGADIATTIFSDKNSAHKSVQSGYFSDWVISQVPYYVYESSRPLTVKTTLIPKEQENVVHIINKALEAEEKRNPDVQPAALTIARDGAITAMVGGRNYKVSPFNRATQAFRQSGSLFKFFVYLTALEKGYQPLSQMKDRPVMIDGWSPNNYGKVFKGSLSLAQAFAQSVNTVAVILAQKVGYQNIISMARRLGVVSSLSPHPSMVLGTDNVTLLEMVQAFAHIPAQGRRVSAYAITEISDDRGETLYLRERKQQPQVINTVIVQHIRNMLEQVVQSGTGKRAQIQGVSVAGKTGTTQDNRDAWFIGTFSGGTTGIWLGYDDNRPMDSIMGGNIPAIIWRGIVKVRKDDGGAVNGHSSVVVLDKPNSFRIGNEFEEGGEEVRGRKEQNKEGFWQEIEAQ